MTITPDYFSICDLKAIEARAQLYSTIRQFFADRHVLEVDTPILSRAATTDVQLCSIAAQRHIAGQQQTHYLHTSPEFAMKRLLASYPWGQADHGYGGIYQICKVFRDDEHGRKHNSEFTMLEWYRPYFGLHQLMQETVDLLKWCLPDHFAPNWQPQIMSYKMAFQQALGCNPLHASVQALKHIALQQGLDIDLGTDRLAYLDLLFSHQVEPYLGRGTPVFLVDFPPEMAALAKHRQDDDGEWVAARFEVYSDGLELANGYDELNDAQLLKQRFEQDNLERVARGLPRMPIDQHLLDALPAMPPCAGIALGIDRLLMVKLQRNNLHEVLAFPAPRA